MNFYFTFMQRSSLRNNFVVIEAETEGKARHLMSEAYGLKWAFCYTEEQWKRDEQEFRFGITEVPLGTEQLLTIAS